MQTETTNTTQLIRIPPAAILARYTETAPGQYAVITSRGEILAPSFYALRNSYTASATINGRGNWVILIPTQTQPQLF